MARVQVDYDALYRLFEKGEVCLSQIMEQTGLDKKKAYQILTSISLKWPVYRKRRGVYALLDLDKKE